MDDYKNGLMSESIVYCTALYLAAQNGHRDVVKFISELPIKPIGNQLFKYTAFYFAAQNGHLSVLEHFARNGINFMDDMVDEKRENSAEDLGNGQIMENNCNGSNAAESIDQIATTSTNYAYLNTVESNQNITTQKVLIGTTGRVVEEEKCGNIFDAVQKASIAEINNFIDDCLDINATDENGNTILHNAAARGDLNILKIVLDKKAALRLQNKLGNAPIHVACAFGNLGVVEELLERWVDVEILNYLGYTPIHLAAKYDQAETFKLLLNKGASISNEEWHKNGDTCLHSAVEVGCQPVDELYLNPKCKGAIDFNTNGKGSDEERFEIVTIMLKANIGMNITNNIGETAMFYTSDVSLFELLFKSGFDLNMKNKYNETILHHAARCNYVQIVECLLKRQIFDINLAASKDETPLYIAASHGHCDVIELLLNYNALLDSRSSRSYSLLYGDYSYFNALHVAVYNKHYNVVEILLKNGMNANDYFYGNTYNYTNPYRICNNSSPLVIAAINGDVKIAELLLIYGGNKDLPTYDATGDCYIYKEDVLKLIKKYQELC